MVKDPNPKISVHGFNNLTKSLSFNIFDIAYAKTEQHRKEYIEYIDELYNAERLTEILTNVTRIIGANILNIARQDYDPQGASVTMLIAEHELVVTASIGISLFPATARDSLQLITQANQAMQHAKHLGGNRWQFYTRQLRAYSLDRLQLENQLRKAIDEQQLMVHFQPKLHLASDRIRSAEALVRWQHPIRGIMMPGDFISIAEETGLIVALGEQVLNAACAQASRWCHQGPASVVVSVNLSVQQLRQEGFASRVRQALERHNLPARLLELELTESMLAEHSEAIVDNINALQALGVSLSVDDFGTGYSSLAYLKRFPISTLKIDRAFIAALNDAPGDDAIVRAVIAMAHSLSLQVVAEGVETEAQLQFLKENGCDDVQGYLISRPIDAEAFTTLLEQSQPARDLLDTLGR